MSVLFYKNVAAVSVLSLFLSACGGGSGGNNNLAGSPDVIPEITGKGQKGNFLQGAEVTATKLKATGEKDGLVVSSTVQDNSGNFSLQPTWSGWTELNITGTFFNEDAGTDSTTELSLDSITDISSSSANKNVNLFTHFVAARIRQLVTTGHSLDDAWAQAQSEVGAELQLLSEESNVEKLDIVDGTSELSNDNAILLLFSGGLLSINGDAASLLELTDDFATDGKFNGGTEESKNLFEGISNYAGQPTNLDKLAQNLKDAGEENPPARDDVVAPPGWSNQAPIALVEPAFKTIKEGEAITLSAATSSDPEEGVLAFGWSGTGTSACVDSQNCTPSPLSLGDNVITVAVTDEGGSTSKTSSIITVQAADDDNTPPVASLVASKSVIQIGEEVIFDASASSDADGDSLKFGWSGNGTSHCGDTNKCTVSNFSVGDNAITLRVEDDQGGSSSAVSVVKVNAVNVAPIANAGSDKTITVGDSVTLSGLLSRDNDGTIESYQWTEGAVTLGTNSTVALASLTEGVHTITLKVTDDDGASDTDTVRVTVSPVDVPSPTPNVAPIANAGSDRTITVGDSITLSGLLSRDSDGTIESYQWTEGAVTLGTNSTVALASLTEGVHTITLKVTDDDGASDTDTVRVTVSPVDVPPPTPNVAPIANAGSDKTITVGDSVTLSGLLSRDSDGTIESYQWTEGAVTLGTNSTVALASLTEGVHTITLKVTDDDGASDTDTVRITVNPVDVPPPTPNIAPIANAGSDKTITVGESVTLSAAASRDPDGNIVSYEWKKGTSTLGTSVSLLLNSLSEGSHTFTLKVTDNDGASDTDTVSITVNPEIAPPPNVAPVANAGPNENITVGDRVTLSGAASSDPDGNIVSYEWTNERTSTTVGTSVSLTLNSLAEGSHGFILTVTDNDGASDTDRVVVIVKAAEPELVVNTPTATDCRFSSTFNAYFLGTYSFVGGVTGTGLGSAQQYSGINCSGSPVGAPLLNNAPLTYSLENVKTVDSVTTARMTIVVVGQTRKANVRIVNGIVTIL